MAKGRKRIEVSASDLKNGWHDYLDQVSQGRREVVVTRYGRPIATLTPYESAGSSGFFGCLKGSLTVHGDIVSPVEEEWEADA